MKGDYRVRALMQIHSCLAALSTGDVWMRVDFTLPFVPVPDVTIEVNKNLSLIPVEVVWSVKERRFTVYVEDDKELYHSPGKRPIEEVVAGWEKQGWRRDKVV